MKLIPGKLYKIKENTTFFLGSLQSYLSSMPIYSGEIFLLLEITEEKINLYDYLTPKCEIFWVLKILIGKDIGYFYVPQNELFNYDEII